MNPPPTDIHPHTFDELQAEAGADFVQILVDTFTEEAPQLLAELRAAAFAGQAERYRRAAHSLKSNASTFGAQRLAEQARALEHAGLPAPPTTPAHLAELDALAQTLQHTVAALQALARA